ncbi:MAG: ABC transporter ATP-binding protein [Armatimonas sp.]
MAEVAAPRSSLTLGRLLKPYWLWATLAPLCMMVEVTLDLLQPRLLQTIIDRGIAHHDMTLVVHTGLSMIGLAVAGLLAGVGCGVCAVITGQSFGADLRQAVFQKIQDLSFGNLDKLSTGALVTRLTSDVGQVQDLITMLLRGMVRAPLLLIGGLVMAILTSPKLAWLFLALIPVVLLALTSILRKSYPMARQIQRGLDKLNTVLQENLAGVRVVKAFARADYEIGRFGKANEELVGLNTTLARLGALTGPMMTLSVNLGVVAALWIGGVNVRAGNLQVGQVVAFINYLTQTMMALMFVSMLTLQVSRAQASAQRVQEVLGTEPQVQSPTHGVHLSEPRGRVVFENVAFRYETSGDSHAVEPRPVLRNINLVAEPGQTVALLGATGSGKSTLVQLIARFYDVTEGRITLDGVDVRELDEDTLHHQVAIALQESVLFSGTIRDNIRYGRPEASEEEIATVARIAEAEEFIQRFPDGYNTVLGQRGVNLSGGQKQRIAIARALLPRPRVLILDDSTSAVDMRTEARIHEAIAEQPFSQTRFIVAQRISTVRNADVILILEEGEIVDRGTHASLLQSSPIYREIYESQTGQEGDDGHGK